MQPDGIIAYLLTQGILGVVALALGYVCIKLYNKIDRLEKEKIAILEAWRAETKESGKDALSVLQGNSQSLFYLADKIEVGKKDDKQRGR